MKDTKGQSNVIDSIILVIGGYGKMLLMLFTIFNFKSFRV